jgi:DNA repair exonuclease SbcCD ATPase subunit
MPDKPQPPGDSRVEEDQIVAGRAGTYSKRKFTTGRPRASHGISTGKHISLDDIDVGSVTGGGDGDGTDITLAKMQTMEVETTQKQLAALRKTHDEHRSMAETKLQRLKKIEEELAEVRRLNSHKEAEPVSAGVGLSTVEKRLAETQGNLDEELMNKEIFTHMIKRLTSGLLDAKGSVKTTNEQKLQAETEYQGLLLQLHQAKQEQRNLEVALETLTKKANERRTKQEEKLVEIQLAIDRRAAQRVRQEDMEKKREAIAARAKGDLGTEEEEKLKRMFVVRSLYSSMLEQKVQKEAADLEHMEQGFQKIKSATGISDVQEIIQKFKTKDETKHSLLQTDKQTRDRIEQLKEEKAENLAVLEEATTSGMAAGGNREMYQEVDHIDEALNAARKQCNDYKTRATRLDLILEESRMSIRKFLSKLNNNTADLPKMEELPDKIEEVDVKVARLMKNVLASLEELGSGEEESHSLGQQQASSSSSAQQSSSTMSLGDEQTKVSTPFGHANAAKVNDMLFHNMMNVEPDTSGRNIRVKPVMTLKAEEAAVKTGLPLQGDSSYGGDDGNLYEDETSGSDPLVDRETVKKLSDLITTREKQAQRNKKAKESAE